MDAFPHPPTSSGPAATLDAPEVPGTLEQQPPGGIGNLNKSVTERGEWQAELLALAAANNAAYQSLRERGTTDADFLVSVMSDPTFTARAVRLDELEGLLDSFDLKWVAAELENIAWAEAHGGDAREPLVAAITITAENSRQRLLRREREAAQPSVADLLAEAVRRSVPAKAPLRARFTRGVRQTTARRVRSTRRVTRLAMSSPGSSDGSEPPGPSLPAWPCCQAQGREHDGSTTSTDQLTTGFLRLGCGTLAERGRAPESGDGHGRCTMNRPSTDCGRLLSCPACSWSTIVVDADGVHVHHDGLCENAHARLDRTVRRRPLVRLMFVVARLAARGSR
jgi:hypothetical protein